MKVNIKDLHPTQLYLSEKKLAGIQTLYQSAEIINVAPISILAFGDCLLITDGHHRAYQALLAGRDTISAYLKMSMKQNGITGVMVLIKQQLFC